MPDHYKIIWIHLVFVYSVDKAHSGSGTYHQLFFIFFPNSHPR